MTQDIPTSSQLTDYWDASATSKTFRHPVPTAILGKYFPSSGHILDIGCSQGRLTHSLIEQGFVVSGTDTSSAMLGQARKNVPSGDFRQSKDGKLDWADNVFDVAIAVTLFTSVPSEAEQRQIMNEIKRVLKPSGYLFVSDMPLQWSTRYLERYRKGAHRYGQYGVFDLPGGGVVRHHELSYFMQLTSGFTALEMATHSITTMNGNPAQAIRYLGRLG